MHSRDLDALDRHALVMAVWLPSALVAATLLHYGLGAGGWPFTAAGFAVVIAAFAAHVIVNVALGMVFTPKEVALGLTLYAVGLVAFALAIVLSPRFRSEDMLAVSLGFLGTAVAVIFTMIAWLGVRDAFKSFDVIRRFGPR
jgi:hypothetical protein